MCGFHCDLLRGSFDPLGSANTLIVLISSSRALILLLSMELAPGEATAYSGLPPLALCLQGRCNSVGTCSAASWPHSMLTKRLQTEFALCLLRAYSALSRKFKGLVRGLMLKYPVASLPPTGNKMLASGYAYPGADNIRARPWSSSGICCAHHRA